MSCSATGTWTSDTEIELTFQRTDSDSAVVALDTADALNPVQNLDTYSDGTVDQNTTALGTESQTDAPADSTTDTIISDSDAGDSDSVQGLAPHQHHPSDTSDAGDSDTFSMLDSATTTEGMETVSDTGSDTGADTNTAGSTDTATDTGIDTVHCDTDEIAFGAAYHLVGAPLLFAPTETGIGVSVVLDGGDPGQLALWVGKVGEPLAASESMPVITIGCPHIFSVVWRTDGLQPATAYVYRIVTQSSTGPGMTLYEGSFTTALPSGAGFSFALLTDSHIGSNLSYSGQGVPEILQKIGDQITTAAPDFMINLGDMVGFYDYGFNAVPPNGTVTRDAYLNYRSLLGDSIGHVPHFATIGNWEGEQGYFADDEIAWSRTARKTYLPGPAATTYSEGGSVDEDYYAFTWGDALFIVLNVETYTTSAHRLGDGDGTAEDWTLGDTQMAWLKTTLENASSKWRFLCIHHPVGGNAGDDINSAYGRGGGRAANVGEQAVIHQLMIDYGVQIFFYGHDHVFVDMVVDNIHYTLPGSAGAPWLFTSERTGYEDYIQESGWARVDVSPDSVTVTFISQDGEVLDDYVVD